MVERKRQRKVLKVRKIGNSKEDGYEKVRKKVAKKRRQVGKREQLGKK